MKPAVSVEPAHEGTTGVATVIHVVNGEFYAGAERVQELLARRLPDCGYRVRFACLKRGQFQQRLAGDDVPCLTTAMRSRLDVVRSARAVAAFAVRERARLIHTHTARSALVGALASRLCGVPLVHHVHSPTARDSARRWINRVNAWVERVALMRARALVAVSQSMADDLRARGYPPERIVVVPNGVAVAAEHAAVAGHAERPTPGNDLTVAVVALFRPRKGIETLLDAMALLAERGHRVRLEAIGTFETPEYEARIRQRCRQLGLSERVHWRGFCRDVMGQLRSVDVLALPSLYGEGMPMVVLEAMAAALPVVATRVEGVPEVVRDGRDGVLVEPGDADAMATALAMLATHPERLVAMGVSGRRRQREEFSDEAMALRLSGVYDHVLKRPAPAAGSPRTGGVGNGLMSGRFRRRRGIRS